MSWFYFTSSTHVPTFPVTESKQWELENANRRIYVFGHPDTICAHHDESQDEGWLVVGTVLGHDEGKRTVLSKTDWLRLLAEGPLDCSLLDGHFVLIRWKADEVQCQTDRLGLRTAYFVRDSTGIHLTNRLDWIASTTGHSRIDLKGFGSKWLLLNQIGFSSCVEGVQRLGPGASMKATHHELLAFSSYKAWLPLQRESTANSAMQCLSQIIHAMQRASNRVSIGLSGGLDSRMLLAVLLLNAENSSYATHTIGDSDDPDVYLAERIAQNLQLEHHSLAAELPHLEQGPEWLRAFAIQTQMSESIVTSHKLSFFHRLPQTIDCTLDGGFAEIARRKFLQRLSRFGSKALEARDAKLVMPYLSLHRADLFVPDMLAEMQAAALEAVQRELDELPSVREFGVENVVDLFAIRTRFPNYEPPEQARHDAAIRNLMPMVQPSFLDQVFAMSLSQRRNARWFYDTIREASPALARIPLEKSGYTYAFGSGSVRGYLGIRLKKKLLRGYKDPWPDRLLQRYKDFILQTVHSQDVRECGLYDYARLVRQTEGYYKGDVAQRDTLAWWMSFEWWRQGLSK